MLNLLMIIHREILSTDSFHVQTPQSQSTNTVSIRPRKRDKRIRGCGGRGITKGLTRGCTKGVIESLLQTIQSDNEEQHAS